MRLPRAAFLSVAVLCLGGPVAAQPSAYDLFREVRQAYAELASYRDHGKVEIVVADSKVERMARFDAELTASAEGGFRFVLRPEGQPKTVKVLWREGQEAFAYDSRLGQVRPVASLLDEVLGSLGESTADALVVPALLVSGGDVLADPEVAKVEGAGPCGKTSTCWQLLISRRGGSEARLWVDQETHTIRQVEIRFPERAGRRSRIRVTHEIDAVDQPIPSADLVFVPPLATRHIETWQREAEPAGEGPGDIFSGEVTVALSTMVARVLRPTGEPILGLKPEDFRVRVGKMEIPVVAVDWVSSQAPADGGTGEEPVSPEASTAAADEEATAAPGKHVVVFVQADLEPMRITGQLGLLPHVRNLLESLGPSDRVAVVSFDSHLKLWLDWTDDDDAVIAAVAEAARFGGRVEVPHSEDPESLTRYFDQGAAKRAANTARALELTARSLVPLPGEKVIVFAGWGFRKWEGAGMLVELLPALRALREAQATVFILDITQAGGHDLERGLRLMAAARGGTYSKTVGSPLQAINRLSRAISGHYVITVDRSELPATGDLRVELRKKSDALVLIRAGTR